LATVAVQVGHQSRAARLLGAWEHLREAGHDRHWHWRAADSEAAALQDELSEFHGEAYAEGRAMTLSEAVAYALEDEPEDAATETESEP
jgi:hypothetical protein